jgi:hypothetical protein|tara:strand:- start:1327 stop:2166 length:840 start_codon:yes stop_codon:yes gene_type:complete
MASPSTRQELIDYSLRKLGAPVLEINVDDDQIDDLVDDTIQYFQERHYDGSEKTFLKYQITQDDIDRGKGPGKTGVSGITTTTVTESVGITSEFKFYENNNYIKVPESVLGINRIFKFDTNSISGGMFSIKYQLFLNDLYYFSSVDLLNYAMTKRYLEDIDFMLTTDKQIRFAKRQGRLYLDIDWGAQTAGDYIVIECIRALNPADFTKIYNDTWVKRYLTSLIKRQWGANMMKFSGTKLPGGVELNGRQYYEDGNAELREIEDKMASYYELPPMDMIG